MTRMDIILPILMLLLGVLLGAAVACLLMKGKLGAAFDEAFSALARGALIQSDRGTVSIEDLLPGDLVRTVENGFQPLLWKGSTQVHAQARAQDERMRRLYRIPADSLGIAKPANGLAAANGARRAGRAHDMAPPRVRPP